MSQRQGRFFYESVIVIILFKLHIITTRVLSNDVIGSRTKGSKNFVFK